jgi:hypothetical protein
LPYSAKLFNLLKAFENRRLQILCSHLITDFSELPRGFENWPSPILPVFKLIEFFSTEQFSFEKLAAQHPPLKTNWQGLVSPLLEERLEIV